MESITFGSPFQAELRLNDEAVYIGTIGYYRDESNKVTSIMVRDDSPWADSRFKERFSAGKTLRKSHVTPAPFT